MSLQDRVTEEIKTAMKQKDTVRLEALRAIKSAILLTNTQSGAAAELKEGEEIALLQKLVKQRRDSATIYTTQGRKDLAEPELAQAAIIEEFLPEQMSKEEIETIVEKVIAETGAQGMKDMGTVMGKVVSAVAGKADGKTVADIVKQKLT